MKVGKGAAIGRRNMERSSDKASAMVSDESRREKQRAKYIWRCEICGRCLCSKRSYSEHKNTHNSARPFKCESCDYAAASQMTLRRHTLRQHVPRSHWHYPCPYCEQAFVEPTSYQAHLRHKHAGYSGTFGCDKCDYKTLSSKNFVDHVLKHVHVRSKKRPTSKNIKDFTDRETIGKCLVSDELGVGWGQRPTGAAIDEQELSLRRIATSEHDRRRRGPVISAVYSKAANQQTRLNLSARGITASASTRRYVQPVVQEAAVNSERMRRSGIIGSSMDNDHEYQTALSNPSVPTTSGSRDHVTGRRQHGIPPNASRQRVVPLFPNIGFDQRNHPRPSQPPTSSLEQACPVPEAECYIEVATASDAYLVPAEVVEDGENEGSSTSDSGSDNEEDDDSASCSSSNSVEIGLRLTALTAEIDMEAQKSIVFSDMCEQECQDLGNDVLPDGQVDFDLD